MEQPINKQVHAIFRPENFSGARLDREKLMPALILTSRLMNTDPALRFFWTVFFASRESRTPPVSVPNRTLDWHYEYPSSKLTTEQSQATLDALNDLADNATFDINHDEDFKWSAYCENFQRFNVKATAPFPNGTKSNIAIDQSLYRTAIEAENAEDRNIGQLEFAMNLLHELAHAAVNAARGRNSTHQHSLVPGSKTSEEGLELVQSIFGGLLWSKHIFYMGHDSKGVRGVEGTYTAIVFTEDTSSHFRRHYGLEIMREPENVNPSRESWQVDAEWVQNLFEDEFWADNARREERFIRPALGVCLRGVETPQILHFAKASEVDEVVEGLCAYTFEVMVERDKERKRKEAHQVTDDRV